ASSIARTRSVMLAFPALRADGLRRRCRAVVPATPAPPRGRPVEPGVNGGDDRSRPPDDGPPEERRDDQSLRHPREHESRRRQDCASADPADPETSPGSQRSQEGGGERHVGAHNQGKKANEVRRHHRRRDRSADDGEPAHPERDEKTRQQREHPLGGSAPGQTLRDERLQPGGNAPKKKRNPEERDGGAQIEAVRHRHRNAERQRRQQGSDGNHGGGPARQRVGAPQPAPAPSQRPSAYSTHHLFPSLLTLRYSVSRSTGRNPASRIPRCRSPTATSWFVPAPPTFVMSDHTTVPSTSSAPACSMNCAMLSVCMIRNAFACGKLSSISRATASVRRFSKPDGPGRCSSAGPSGKNGSGMIVWK